MLKDIEIFLGTDNFALAPLLGDASSRNYSRISSDKNFVLMQSTDTETNKNFVNVLNILQTNLVNVPKLFLERSTFFILEDLGDVTLESFFFKQEKELIINFYKKAIDQLIQIQKIEPKLSKKFDAQKLLEELIFFKNQFFKESDKICKDLDREFLDLSQRLDLKNHSRCFVHRDFHSRNIMVHKGQLYIIDFQDARIGIPHYDLVSLLQDSYTNIDFENHLLDYYFENYPFKLEKDNFIENYKICSIQRGLKACGSFKSFDNLKNNKRYLKYIPICLDNVLNSLNYFSEYKVLFKIIQDLRASL